MEHTTTDNALEDAIRALLSERGDNGSILTGWVLTATLKHPVLPTGDGYVTLNSDGLPYHSQLGLLVAALNEKRNQILINTLAEVERGE